MHRYFARLGLAMPDLRVVGIGPRSNAPTGYPPQDGEVVLDIQVAGAVANGAKIVVYFAPNTSRGWLKCINAAVHDSVNNPTILSTSWGHAESYWSVQDIWSMSEAFQAAALLGISVFAASGDNGSVDAVPGSDEVHVDFPASSPWATGCGGTTISSTGGALVSETVWNDGAGHASGGGISDVFSMPPYQSGIPLLVASGMRGVPDVAGCVGGYHVRVDGHQGVWTGTSAVAPLWAGLFALLNESLGSSVGFANPLIYSVPVRGSTALRGIVDGNNDPTGRVGKYLAGPDWNPCTGLGSPNGQDLLAKI
jgi:kumamolisin